MFQPASVSSKLFEMLVAFPLSFRSLLLGHHLEPGSEELVKTDIRNSHLKIRSVQGCVHSNGNARLHTEVTFHF